MKRKLHILLITLLFALASFFVACGGGTNANTYKVTLPVNIEGGIVTADKTEVANGESVTITATPSLGYELTELAINGEALSINPLVQDYVYEPTSDITVTAAFALKTYTVSVSSTSNGTVSVSKETAKMGDTVTVTATANAGYEVSVISIAKDAGGAVSYNTENSTFVMPADNVTVTVVYEQICLAAPTVTQNGKTLSWEAITGAAGYAYSLNEGETWETTTQTSLTLTSGIHTVWVKTLGNGQTSFDSQDIAKGEYDARDSLSAVELTVTKAASAYEISWVAVDNASGYNYRVTVNGEAGEWIVTTATSMEIAYADYPTGEYRFAVEVEALGGDVYKGTSATTDVFSIADPTFTTLPVDQIVYAADHYFDLSGMNVTSDNGTVTWTARLVGAEQVSTNAAQWAPAAGDTILYDSEALGYTQGVMTQASLSASGQPGAYVWGNNALRVEYVVTNEFGRTATCYQTLVVNEEPSRTLTGIYTQDIITDVIGGEVMSMENTISPILGTDRIYKLSNNGNYNYVDYVWNPDAYVGEKGKVAQISFFVYNPNDFDLAFFYFGMGGSTQGFMTVKAHTFMKINGYNYNIDFAYLHQIIKEDGKLGSWNIDVRKLTDASNPSSMVPAVYDFYIGNVSYSFTTKMVSLPEGLVGGSVTADKTSLREGNVTLTVNAEDGYKLSWLKVNDVVVECTNNTYTVENVETNLVVTAAFEKLTYGVTVSAVSNGTVDVVSTSAWGETVTITATPADGYGVRDITVTDAQGNAIELVNGTFVMPQSNVTVNVVFAKNLIKLATPSVSHVKGETGYTVTWSAVENASGYNYRVTVNGEAGEWTSTTETSLEIAYANYPTGEVSILVEVLAVGEGDFTNSDAVTSEEMTIVDPTFTTLPQDQLVYAAEHFFDLNGMNVTSDSGTVTWTATLIGAEQVSTNAAQWAPAAGDTILYDSEALGYTQGVMTQASLSASGQPGAYVWGNNALRVEYVVTNEFGRTATCYQTLVVNEEPSRTLTGIYTQDIITDVIGGEVMSMENTISPILGTDRIYKLSNNGNYNYVDYVWNPDAYVGEKGKVAQISFFVYNPNDFDLAFFYFGMGGSTQGFMTVKAHTFMKINGYNYNIDFAYLHQIIKEDGKLGSWNIDVRKLTDASNPGSMVPAVYDFYIGNVSYTFTTKTVSVPTGLVGGSVTADKASLKEGNVTLTVNTEDGYKLSWLKVNDVAVDCTGNTYVVENVQENVVVTAAFEKQTYNVTVSALSNGTVDVVSTSAWGETITITTTPADGYNVRSVTVTDEHGNAIELLNGTFVMPQSDVTISVEFAQNIVVLDAPNVSFEKSGMGYMVTWTAVENASSYNYRKIVDNVAGQWVNTTETEALVAYGDYPTGEVKILVEVVAVGESNFANSDAAVSDEMIISDPTFTYKPKNIVVNEAEYFVPFPVTATTEDKYGMKGVQFDAVNGAALTWTATLYGAEMLGSEGAWDREWNPDDGELASGVVASNGQAMTGYSSWVGYVNGVMTEQTIGSFNGIYIWSPLGVRITYTLTNDFGRTATYTHCVVANNRSTDIAGACSEANMSAINGGIEYVPVSGAFGCGTEGAYKMSNNGTYTYLEFSWTPNVTVSEYKIISFFVYNPNDFDLCVAWMGSAYKGFYNVKANTLVEFNIYAPSETAVYAAHGLIDGEGKTTAWTIDVRRLSDESNPSSMIACAYDLYVGGLRIS